MQQEVARGQTSQQSVKAEGKKNPYKIEDKNPKIVARIHLGKISTPYGDALKDHRIQILTYDNYSILSK